MSALETPKPEATLRPKPGRPLGVSLAVTASILLFSFVPLIQVVFLLNLRQHIFIDSETGASGVNVLGVSDTNLLIQFVLGLVFFVIALFAWRGRPASMRFVLLAAVLLLTVLTVTLTILPQLTQPACDPATLQSCDSSVEVSRSIAWGRLVVTLLVPLYVVWYVNRGPARAFYRGYYLPDPADTGDG
jgi:cytochrome bd-type quinol oxidase subunit 2